jgi:hypothetical protein
MAQTKERDQTRKLDWKNLKPDRTIYNDKEQRTYFYVCKVANCTNQIGEWTVKNDFIRHLKRHLFEGEKYGRC